MIEEPGQSGEAAAADVVAEKRARDRIADAVADVEDIIHVVRDEAEPRIDDAAVDRHVVRAPALQAALLVANERVDRDEAVEFIEIEHPPRLPPDTRRR